MVTADRTLFMARRIAVQIVATVRDDIETIRRGKVGDAIQPVRLTLAGSHTDTGGADFIQRVAHVGVESLIGVPERSWPFCPHAARTISHLGCVASDCRTDGEKLKRNAAKAAAFSPTRC
jgi:hypothetical protein